MRSLVQSVDTDLISLRQFRVCGSILHVCVFVPPSNISYETEGAQRQIAVTKKNYGCVGVGLGLGFDVGEGVGAECRCALSMTIPAMYQCTLYLNSNASFFIGL